MTTTTNALLVEEIFETIQGEGAFTGVPVSFVRLYGCPVGCDFCDQGWAAAADATRQNPHHWMAIADIIQQVSSYAPQRIVISGGEPLLQKNCAVLIRELQTAGFTVHIETAGIASVSGADLAGCWITFSPKDKVARSPHYKSLEFYWKRADEIKLVIEDGTELKFYQAPLATTQAPVYLQPEWNNLSVTSAIAVSLLQDLERQRSHQGRTYKLSLQTHKFLNLP
ncbi:MAG: 7-carboxy-7-deazaguanine synthase QueE [Leptolyngbyaceae cyanobacterium CSU_1_4]|nr:7-carboxy-7-deazaguanine synthase QueE [Leptolyngbyaceae cyanobacterium CSU_1_4]